MIDSWSTGGPRGIDNQAVYPGENLAARKCEIQNVFVIAKKVIQTFKQC